MLQDRIRGIIARSGMRASEAHTLVGLSGGVDSVTLVHVLMSEGVSVEAAHVNAKLRGNEADEDEAFVRTMCKEKGIQLNVASINVEEEAIRTGESIQMAARRTRYDFLSSLAVQQKATHISLGHHADDQAETVLLNLLRGTGPEGLAGMPAVRPLAEALLVRPLLGVRRTEILSYATAQGLTWRDDTSNLDTKYVRNHVRTAVIPAMDQACGADASAAIVRSAALLRAYVEENLQPNTAAVFADAANEHDRSLRLDALEQAAPVWRSRVILEAVRKWAPEVERTTAVAGRVDDLIRAQPGRRVRLGSVTVWRDRDRLTFQTPLPAFKDAELWPDQPARIHSGQVRMVMRPRGRMRLDDSDDNTAFADARRLVFPLTVRKWRKGDRLRPLGLDGSKKVSDLLTDAKVRSSERHGIHVVTSDGQVVWVVGVRLAAPFRVTDTTRKVALLRFEPRRLT